MDKDALEAALDEVFNSQQDESSRPLMVHGHPNASGVDPDFASQLHDKLAAKTEPPEPSGLRAPCTTQMLSAKDLAALGDDEEDEDGKVVLDTKSHGFMDQVDSKLVTELNKKLSDEAQQASPQKPPGGGQKADFSSDLTAAFERKLGDQASDGNTDFAAALGQKLQLVSSGEADASGLRAPQCTVKLSAEVLSGLDDDLEVVEDAAQLVAVTHGRIEEIDDKLVLELQKKLGAEAPQTSVASNREPSGFRAPQNTVKLEASMLPEDDEADERAGSGYRAPQCTVKLGEDVLANLDDDGDAPAAPFDAPAAQEGGSGLRAPQPTQLITADMLASLDDEVEDLNAGSSAAVAQPSAGAGAKPNEAKPKKGGAHVGFSGAGGFDPNFADSLQQKLDSGGGRGEPSVVEKAASKDASMDALQAGLQKAFGAGSDGAEDSRYMSGLKAPSCTQNIADKIALLDDEEDAPTRTDMSAVSASLQGLAGGTSAPSGVAGGAVTADFDDPMAIPSGLKAPQTTCMLSAAQLAAIDAEDAAPVLEAQPAAAPPQAAAVDSEFASKVIQTMRDMPEGMDMWGQPKTLTSSCKLRLAWLTKDEVRKENDQLRKEIASLRAEIEAHRKEACLARKA